MAWGIELDPAAERELDKLDQQFARRILVVRIGNRKAVYRKEMK